MTSYYGEIYLKRNNKAEKKFENLSNNPYCFQSSVFGTVKEVMQLADEIEFLDPCFSCALMTITTSAPSEADYDIDMDSEINIVSKESQGRFQVQLFYEDKLVLNSINYKTRARAMKFIDSIDFSLFDVKLVETFNK